jgi:Sulfotransferase family
MQKRFLFVVGCPRSGTQVLNRVITSHPQIALGTERFNKRLDRRELLPSDFEPERFFDIQRRDTWYRSFDDLKEYYDRIRVKYDDATYLGDKYPGAYQRYGHLVRNFGDIRFIFILRNIYDVAVSFETRRALGVHWPADGGAEHAVTRWNEAIGMTLAWRERTRILTLSYEDLFIRGGSAAPIAEFLELDGAPFAAALDRARNSRKRDTNPASRLPPDQAEYICRHANFGGYRRLLGVQPGAAGARQTEHTVPIAAPAEV